MAGGDTGYLHPNRWQDDLPRLHKIVSEKRWIGIDLDDTLHEIRRASSAASSKVLEAIHEKFDTPFASLNAQYSEILRASTSNAFSDGRSSHEYRRERFLAVASHFSVYLEHNEAFLTGLLALYQTTLPVQSE